MVMKKQVMKGGGLGGGLGGGGGGVQEPRSSSSCAACKFLKRRCTPNCLFAPYFRSDEPKKFAKVHKVFGASNVSKILIEVPEEQREDTVNSLVYEAEARLRDPVYGCIGAIALLQKRMVELQNDLEVARTRLANHYAHKPASNCQALIINSLCDDDLDHIGGGDQHSSNNMMMMSSSCELDEIGGWNSNGLGEIFGQDLLGFNQCSPLDEFFNVPFP